MIFVRNKERELDRELFRNPAAEYRGIPFWSWNCKVTRERIDRDLAVFKEMGFGGVDIHPRSGLDIEYLGPEYLELVRYAVDRCRELGLICWLYDEDRFPSGVAGGLVTRNWRYRGRFLLLGRERRTQAGGFYPDRGSFERAACSEKARAACSVKPGGYYVTAYAVTLEEGYLKSYERLKDEEEIQKAEAQGKDIRYAYVCLMEEEGWFQDQSYADTMNPEATEEFIRLTHERYYRIAGDEFGRAVPAIFTDEARLGRHNQLSRALSEEDVTIPYTEAFAEAVKKQYGMDVLDFVPEYIWQLPRGRYSTARYLYRDAASECFVSTFMDRICDWCRDKGIYMTGHVLAEDTLESQASILGDCMRCYRKMDIPGIDILVDDRNYATAKQAVSVSRQNGKEGTVSELYGVTHWDCSFKTYKLQGDWQAALGINIRVPHLSHMSLGGEAKRDWPGSIFFHAPWYKEFAVIEDHFARLFTALSRGKAIVNIGVVHPVESMWLYMGPDDQTKEKRTQMDEDFERLVKWLIFGTLDFDFLSEALLPGQCAGLEGTVIKEPGKAPRLRVGQMSYDTILVPGLTTIRGTTLDLLEAFKKEGGRIIFMGRIPELVDGRYSERGERLAGECRHIGKDAAELYRELEPARIVEIRKENGAFSDNLLCQLRQDETCKWLFVCHARQKTQYISQEESYELKIKGEYTATLYDTRTGETYPAAVRQEDGYSRIGLLLYGEDSALYQLREAAQEPETGKKEAAGRGTAEWKAARPEKRAWQKVGELREISSFDRKEKNVLLLDYAEYRVDSEPWQEREEILRLDNAIREKLGFALRKERMNQPYYMKEGAVHQVMLRYRFLSQVRTECFLGLEEAASCRVWLNGEPASMEARGFYVDDAISVIALPKLREGENELMVEVNYHQKTSLENMYLLGDFDVELKGCVPVIKKEGKRLYSGSITTQGMPFYTGNLDYHFSFAVQDAGDYNIHIPHFKAPLLGVEADGEKKGLIAYAPHRISLGRLEPGKHELVIRLYGNRYNGFGTLHNANDDFRWYGPDSFRTAGDDWTDCYRLRETGIFSGIELEKLI